MAGRGRVPNGQYKPCPTWGCRNGMIKVGKSGQRVRHQLCGGDGYIRVGTKTKGRPKGKGPKDRGPRGFVNRTAWYAGWAGALFVGMGQSLGTIGNILAAVVIVAFTVLKVTARVVGVK